MDKKFVDKTFKVDITQEKDFTNLALQENIGVFGDIKTVLFKLSLKGDHWQVFKSMVSQTQGQVPAVIACQEHEAEGLLKPRSFKLA